MGGFGSGRTSKRGRRPRNKAIVEHCPCLNSFKFMPRKQALRNERTFAALGRHQIQITKEEAKHIYAGKVLFTTPMQTVESGKGERYFFTCPGCYRRTSRLYLYKDTIRCRVCHNLSYYSQNISNENRWLHRRDKLLKRHGLTGEEFCPYEKKKGMHWKTHERLVTEYDFISDMGINVFFNRFEYKRTLALLRKAKRTGNWEYFFTDYARQSLDRTLESLKK